jgi:hypothetical protein
MGFFLKAFGIFWAIWILWYITGGPLRDDKSNPYVGFTASGTIQSFSTTTLQK